MKNILTYIVLFLTFNVYGQNNSEIVNLDSINFYFGEKLNAERVKVGKPIMYFDVKYSVVELDWIDEYLKCVKKREDEYTKAMNNHVPYVSNLPTKHGTGDNTLLNRYKKHFKKIDYKFGENMAIEHSNDSLNYKELSEKLFNQWVGSKNHYDNMMNTNDETNYHKFCLVVRYIKYNGKFIYMGGLFLAS
jgi:hypothetical protein